MGILTSASKTENQMCSRKHIFKLLTYDFVIIYVKNANHV